MDEKVCDVRRTDDFSKFKVLTGNRGIDRKRIQHIKDSIQSVGYRTMPIMVNEKFEVIDGQGRLAVCKLLNIPVLYVIDRGAGIEECIAMNINQKNWTIEDYIKSKADLGIVDYKYLQALMQAYGDLGSNTVINAIRQQDVNTLSNSRYYMMANNNAIKNGTFKCSDAEYNKAAEILEYVKLFADRVNSICKTYGGTASYWYFAIEFAYRNPHFDNVRMLKRFLETKTITENAATIAIAMDELTRIYNRGLSGTKHFLNDDYRYYQANGVIRS